MKISKASAVAFTLQTYNFFPNDTMLCKQECFLVTAGCGWEDVVHVKINFYVIPSKKNI